MGVALYTNNASSTLAAGINAAVTSFSVAAGQGALFPNPTGGDYFYVTLSDAASGLVIEICKCTARSTDALTVTRGSQGTTPAAFLIADKVELRPTATGFTELAALGGTNTYTGYQALAAGAVGTPSLYLSTDTTTGLYRIGANNDGFAVSGAKVLDIASTGLAVTGTLSSSGATTLSSTLGVTGATTLSSTLSTTSTAVIGSSTNGSLQINNAGGNNAASLWFSGASVASGNKNWLIDSGNFAASTLVFAIANSAGGVIGSSATEVGRFSSTGLAITGTLSATGGYNGTTGATTKNTGAFTTLSSTGTASLCTTSGLVDIGTADINIGYSKMLSILAPATTAGVLIQVQGSAYPCVANWSYDNAGDNTFQYFYANSAGDLKGSISFNRTGNLTVYSTTSDATLKNLIGDAPQARSLEILSQTRLREYSWKSDETNRPQIGVIAQELYEVFPGAVSVGGDLAGTDEDGNPTTKYHPWSVDKTAYQFHLVAGWQNHESKIAALEARLAAVEAK